MFSFLKNYKMHRFLADSLVCIYPDIRIHWEMVESAWRKVFDLGTGQGAENFNKFVKEIYAQKDERIRLKMMILLHFLIKKHPSYAEAFLNNYKTDFSGKVESYSNKTSSYVHPRESSKIFSSIHTIRPSDLNTLSNINSQSPLYNSIHNYIYRHLIIPYHSYLIRLASSQQRYQVCLSNMQSEATSYNCNQCWKLLNILKLISNIKTPINHLGRYHKEQVRCVADFIELISDDLIIYKTQLQKQIQFAFKFYWELEKGDLKGLMLQVEEVMTENQNLFEIFKNKYYYQVDHRLQAIWFTLEEGVMQSVESYYSKTFDFPEVKESHRTSTSKDTQ